MRIGYRLPPRLPSCYELGDNPLNPIVECLLVLYLIAFSVRAYRCRVRIGCRLPPLSGGGWSLPKGAALVHRPCVGQASRTHHTCWLCWEAVLTRAYNLLK